MNARRRCAAVLAAGLSIAAVAGCGDKESLVIVTLLSTTSDPTPTSATISVGKHSETFMLKGGLVAGGVSLGLYVPAGITGAQTVTAVASPAAGGGCEVASAPITIDAAGDKVGPIELYMYPTTTGCTGTTSGGGGITSCSEYDHADDGQCAMGSACTQDHAVYGAAFSPKNASLAVTSGTDGRIKVWTVSSDGSMAAEGDVVTTPSPGYGVVAFSPDGSLLAIGMDGGVQIVSVNNWTTTATLAVASTVYGVAFSPDGSQIITLDTDSAAGTSHLYAHALTTLSVLQTVALSDGYALAVSPVGSAGGLPVAVTTSTGDVLMYVLTAAGFGTPTTLTVTSNQTTAETAQFSPSGNLLAAGGDDGILQFWPIPVTGATQAPSISVNAVTNNVSDWVDVVAFSPAGSELALGGGQYGTVTTYATSSRAHTGVEQDTSNNFDVVSLGYSPDGKLIIGGEGDCGCVFLCKH